MSEFKEPRLFSAFYESTMALLQKNKAQRTADAIKKTLAPAERILNLQESVARGREAKKFIDGDFWVEHLEPFLRSEAVLKPAIMKDGDPAPTERILHEFLIDSGKVRVIARLLHRLEQWQTEGEEAKKILEMESEKRQKLREHLDSSNV